MDSKMLLRVTLLIVWFGYVIPRTYFRLKARRSSQPGESPLKNVTESKLRLALMGVTGIGADLLSIGWAINPAWVSWSDLPLPHWLRWIGGVVGVVAVWLGYLTHRTIGANYTPTLKTKQGHQLVTEGIYRWIRHPMYTSFFALLAACFLLTANWLVGALGLIYSLLVVERVVHEERMMLEAFGEEYHQYMWRTGRFFPHLMPEGKRQ
jgi:protein-S-isoprenylcysteine O-methyltransferase Ste14